MRLPLFLLLIVFTAAFICFACGDDEHSSSSTSDDGDTATCEDYCNFIENCGWQFDECLTMCIENDYPSSDFWDCYLSYKDDCDAFDDCKNPD